MIRRTAHSHTWYFVDDKGKPVKTTEGETALLWKIRHFKAISRKQYKALRYGKTGEKL